MAFARLYQQALAVLSNSVIPDIRFLSVALVALPLQKMLSSLPRQTVMSSQGFAASGFTFRDATAADAKDLNELYNSVIKEEISLEWDEERPLSEHEFYLKSMICDEYPCILVYEGNLLVAYGSLERWTVGEGTVTF